MTTPLTRKPTSHFLPRVVSGIQPSGDLHIGNYFGAIKQHVDLQGQYPGEAFYFIADYHALTTLHDREELQKQSRNIALAYLALGLNPEHAIFYRQSDIPQVCELMWILSCVTGKGLMERGHAYKDKVQKGLSASVGLFQYPLLMAADILLARATRVPVGEDQSQHLEMTRDIAGYFNSAFGESIFPYPETLTGAAAIVLGLDGRKMSKSYDNTIAIFATRKEIQRKVAAIKTSSASLGDPLDPDEDVTFRLYQLVAEPEDAQVLRERYTSGRIGYGEAKRLLSDALYIYFGPARDRRKSLENDPDFVEDVLRSGAARMWTEAEETLVRVRETVGLGLYERAWTRSYLTA